MKNDKFKGFITGVALTLMVCLTVPAFAATVKNKNLVFRDIKLVIAGKEFTPKDSDGNVVEPFIIAGTTYLPLRAIADGLGEEVSWDGNTSTITIGRSPIVPTPDGFVGLHDLVKVRPFITQLKESAFPKNDTIVVRGKEVHRGNIFMSTSGNNYYNLDGEFTTLSFKIATDDKNYSIRWPRISLDGERIDLLEALTTAPSISYNGTSQSNKDVGVSEFEVDLIGHETLNIDIWSDRYDSSDYGIYDVFLKPININDFR